MGFKCFLQKAMQNYVLTEKLVSKILWFENFFTLPHLLPLWISEICWDIVFIHIRNIYFWECSCWENIWSGKQENNKLKLFLWYLTKEFGRVARLFMENVRDIFFIQIKLKDFFKATLKNTSCSNRLTGVFRTR